MSATVWWRTGSWAPRMPESRPALQLLIPDSASPGWPGLACTREDPEIFFSDDPAVTHEAKQVCEGCPARQECLDWIVGVESRLGAHPGVYGGLTDDERAPLRRRLCQEAPCDVEVKGASRYCPECAAARRKRSRAAYDERRRLSA